MNTPRTVSVIIPNYNGGRTLELCLRSVLTQHHRPAEVIVVDDCSTDDSVAIAERAGARVVRTPRNSGCGVARNLGATHASGAVLFFVDSDVALEPDAISSALSVLGSEPTIGAVCGIEHPVPLLNNSLVARFRALQYHYWSASSEGNVSFLFPNICAIRADVFAELGPFSAALRQTEEVDYGYRLSRRYRLRLTSAVRGRHDHDARLVTLLRKLFQRGRLRVPLYAKARRFAKGFETANRAYASVAALLAVVSTVLPLAAGALAAAVPVLLFAVSVGLDAGMYRFVLREQGPAFLGYFTVMQFLVNVTIAASVAVGAAQWIASRRFRVLYDTPAVTS
ncbi:glycosyltransferase family 2 protein [Amycolatopsis pigmentata]|uniref:Glycosyltransferase family 2 protein n=1 Tax=Amycolatopsis pigmentata TaxID=450801 RepID=A0ABW5G7Y7_9PSEU